MPTVYSTSINRPMGHYQQPMANTLKDLVRTSSPLPGTGTRQTHGNIAPGPRAQQPTVTSPGQPKNFHSVNQHVGSRLDPTAESFEMQTYHKSTHCRLQTARVVPQVALVTHSCQPISSSTALFAMSAFDTTRKSATNASGLTVNQVQDDEDGFKPTTMALYGPGVQRHATFLEGLTAIATGMSPNYRGDPGNPLNYNMVDLLDELNCSYWLTKLPVDVEENEILGAIEGCGKIFAIHINNEDAHRFGHAGCKLMFMDVKGATNFNKKYVVPQALVVRGYKIHIRRNRIKAAEQAGLKGKPNSRCVRVTGPRRLANRETLLPFFDKKFKYKIDQIIDHTKARDQKATLEIRFGSYRAQASFAFKVLRYCPVFQNGGVKVAYVRDPCE